MGKIVQLASLGTLCCFLVSPVCFSEEQNRPLEGVTVLQERSIPLPVGVSPEMTEIIAARQMPPAMPMPTTTQEWLKLQAAMDAPNAELGRQAVKRTGATYEVKDIAGVRSYVVTPKTINKRFADRVFVHVHGGAFVFNGGDAVLREAVQVAHSVGVKVISVDYRRPPTDPFPAALEDTLAVWKHVTNTQKASETALFGTSAGGNIALATVLKLKQLGEPLPGAVFAGTPATDLKHTTDTWYTLEGLDPLGPRSGALQATFDLYAGNEDLMNPLLSPIYGDLKGFPPTILISGTRDLLLSDTVRMHRALRSVGAIADLHVYDGQAHADYLQGVLRDLPESDDAMRELFEFFDKHLE